jgi:hypothetical protein
MHTVHVTNSGRTGAWPTDAAPDPGRSPYSVPTVVIALASRLKTSHFIFLVSRDLIALPFDL